MARVLNGLQDSRLCNLVEHDAVGLLLIQSQHLAEVPGDGLSLTVFIGRQPHLLGLLGLLLQFADQFFLLVGNLVLGFQRCVVYTQFFFLQVADMAVARHHFEVLA